MTYFAFSTHQNMKCDLLGLERHIYMIKSCGNNNWLYEWPILKIETYEHKLMKEFGTFENIKCEIFSPGEIGFTFLS